MRIQNNTSSPVLIADLSDQPIAIPANGYRDFYDTDALAKSYAISGAGLQRLIAAGTVSVVAVNDLTKGVDVGNAAWTMANGISGKSGATGSSGTSGATGPSGSSGFSGYSGVSGV